MNIKKWFQVKKEIEEANKNHVEDWKKKKAAKAKKRGRKK